MHRPVLLSLAFAVLLVFASCGGDDAAPSPVPAEAGGNGTEWGVAGVIPPHYPSPTGADYARLFASYTETGTLAGVYLNWADSPADEGGVPRGVASLQQAVASRHVYPLGLRRHEDVDFRGQR